jgi:hypothetical protein
MDTLALSGLLSLLVASVYGYVGYRLARRAVSRRARPAHLLFITWWIGLAVTSLIGAVNIGLYLGDWFPYWLYATMSQLSLLAILVALLGLLYYLIYLYTGSSRALPWLVVVYVLFYAVVVGLVQWLGAPDALTDDGWSIQQQPQPTLPAPVLWGFLLLLLAPQLGAAAAYLFLLRRAETTTQRYRIILVAGSIIVWFGSSILASAAQVGTELWWQLASRGLSIMAALVILAAYTPPGFVKRRFGILSIDDEVVV